MGHEGLRKSRAWLVGGGRRAEVCPEERVVDVTAGIKVDSSLEVELCREIIVGGGGSLGGEGGIEIVDVGLVVFRVVEGHDLRGDVRFKCLAVD